MKGSFMLKLSLERRLMELFMAEFSEHDFESLPAVSLDDASANETEKIKAAKNTFVSF